MVNYTRKKGKMLKNKTSKISVIKNKRNKTTPKKRLYDDNEIGEICSTGQFSMYKGNFYKNPKNLEKFKEVRDKFRKNPKYKTLKTYKEKYTAFLKENFAQINLPKVLHLIKNDYYTYVNDEWFKKHDIEKKSDKDKNYYVQYDHFRIVQEEVYHKLIDYMKTYIKENPKDKRAMAIDIVYKSLYNDTRKTMFKHVDAVVDELDGFIQSEDMYGLLAMINSNETISLYSPIQWYLNPDEKNVKKYISHVSFGKLGIYDYLIYINTLDTDDAETKKYKSKVKREYLKYIDEVFKACLGEKRAKEYKAQDIWDVEYDMLLAMGCDEHIKTDPNFYNKVKTNTLEKTYEKLI